MHICTYQKAAVWSLNICIAHTNSSTYWKNFPSSCVITWPHDTKTLPYLWIRQHEIFPPTAPAQNNHHPFLATYISTKFRCQFVFTLKRHLQNEYRVQTRPRFQFANLHVGIGDRMRIYILLGNNTAGHNIFPATQVKSHNPRTAAKEYGRGGRCLVYTWWSMVNGHFMLFSLIIPELTTHSMVHFRSRLLSETSEVDRVATRSLDRSPAHWREF